MNHKIKRKWIAALRGGTWEQCFGQTSEGGNRRCALGVLGEVMGLDVFAAGSGAGHDNYVAIAQKAGINWVLIVDLNDLEYRSFPEIADWVEENIPDSPAPYDDNDPTFP